MLFRSHERRHVQEIQRELQRGVDLYGPLPPWLVPEALHVHAQDGRQASEGGLFEARLPPRAAGATCEAVSRLEALPPSVLPQAVFQGPSRLPLLRGGRSRFLR